MVSKKLTVEESLHDLICFANIHLSLRDEDNIYYFNHLCGILNYRPQGIAHKCDLPFIEKLKSPACVIAPVVEYAIANKIIQPEDAKSFSTRILAMLTPLPSGIIDIFNSLAEDGEVKRATDWFYDLSFKSDYIPFDEVSGNIKWQYPCEKGVLDITINTAKPEKSNADIAKLLKAKSSGYPKCAICADNVGYFGDEKIPPRQTLRVLPLSLNGEEWFFQYSPYNYFNEHCIVFSAKHEPMKLDVKTFSRLLDFVEQFPHYFMGSNADLPIVGGSIMTHNHFQGGSYAMPMFSAKPRFVFDDAEERDITVSVPDWYASCIRIESRNRHELITAAQSILNGWRKYKNENVGIIDKTDAPHNTVTTICRINDDGEYCMELLLRNNRTDETYPDGIFHAHPEHHNIKKEGIGLIEAMGVFILPGRLSREAEALCPYFTGDVKFDRKSFESSPLSVHVDMIENFLKEGTVSDADTAAAKIENHVNLTCEDILKNIAVFKEDAPGNIAFIGFMSSLGFTLKKE